MRGNVCAGVLLPFEHSDNLHLIDQGTQQSKSGIPDDVFFAPMPSLSLTRAHALTCNDTRCALC